MEAGPGVPGALEGTALVGVESSCQQSLRLAFSFGDPQAATQRIPTATPAHLYPSGLPRR
jgi:hypothetical protein